MLWARADAAGVVSAIRWVMHGGAVGAKRERKKNKCRCYILITSIVTYVQSTHPPVSGAFGSSGFEPDLGFSPRHPTRTYVILIGCRLPVYRSGLPSSIER